ncbi:YolD-like family protein [Edaphobacillus lindanitolerans]|uniref:YolD-like protein n=1 Tax=Edaphobacillus lindanitolerans TaxID=550447 RepID=A0A1U7PQ58_9BACI|nr:YolD-like family protein [Edaphobacillus lindanitolerans]SIT91798.1 YolD-like protein [Edaphobacillus lindanitolerans]
MLRDRGNIKWTAMMLPEHIHELRKWEEEDKLVKRPELTEWDLQEIQAEIDTAMRRRCQVEVQTWRAGEIRTHIGVIENLDPRLKLICVADGWVDVNEIITVRMLE